MKVIIALLCIFSVSYAKTGFGPGEQDWGFETVRPGADTFWWLYYTTANVTRPEDKPLVIWLQGGPGGSSTGYGNFIEIGPLDTELKPRNYTWVKKYNVLFIDNPVGTGYSHCSSESVYVTNNTQIAKDLLVFMHAFYKKLPQFVKTPLYVASESYGGKMAIEFVWELDKAVKAGTIESNIKGVALIDSWISPVDSTLTYAPYLLAMGVINDAGFKKIGAAAQTCARLIAQKQWLAASTQWSYVSAVVKEVSHGVDFYNILTKVEKLWRRTDLRVSRNERSGMFIADENTVNSLMQNEVKAALDLPANASYTMQSSKVFAHLSGDFMKPVIDIVQKVVDETDLKVFVLSGQLDLIVDTPGTYTWAKQITVNGKPALANASRKPLVAQKYIEGYVQQVDNFAFYWVDRSGHMVPMDNYIAMQKILEDLIQDDAGK